MLGSGVVITMYYALAAVLRAVLEKRRARCWAQQISCGALMGSGLAFRYFFASLQNQILS